MAGHPLNVGIITYHAAYNYGSVLQAYAAQAKLAGMGHNVCIFAGRGSNQRLRT